jgi:hypothetical protein
VVPSVSEDHVRLQRLVGQRTSDAGSRGLTGCWSSHVTDEPRIACPDLAIVRACLRETDVAVRSAANLVCIDVVLSVVMPPAHLADIVPSAFAEGSRTATRTSYFLGSHDKLPNVTAFSGERPPERSEEGRSSAAMPGWTASPLHQVHDRRGDQPEPESSAAHEGIRADPGAARKSWR